MESQLQAVDELEDGGSNPERDDGILDLYYNSGGGEKEFAHRYIKEQSQHCLLMDWMWGVGLWEREVLS